MAILSRILKKIIPKVGLLAEKLSVVMCQGKLNLPRVNTVEFGLDRYFGFAEKPNDELGLLLIHRRMLRSPNTINQN